MTLQLATHAQPFTRWHHLRNYEHSMGNLEHKGLIYLRDNRFWTKNKTPFRCIRGFWYFTDEMGMSSQNMKYDNYAPQGIQKDYYIPW